MAHEIQGGRTLPIRDAARLPDETLRVFTCDDEPLALARLDTLLNRIGGVEVVGSATDPVEALTMIEKSWPDLLLVDVEMPGLDGFDLIEAVRRSALDPPPLVAFVTAFRKFAVEAFGYAAIDFLAKPVRATRLEEALERARAALAGRRAMARVEELEQLNVPDADVEGAGHIWVSRRGELVRVEFGAIDRVEAEGAYVRIFVGANSYLHRETLGGLAEKLDQDSFRRVHRSHLVSLKWVSAIRRTIHGGTELVLSDGRRVPVGRKFARDAKLRLLSKKPPDLA